MLTKSFLFIINVFYLFKIQIDQNYNKIFRVDHILRQLWKYQKKDTCHFIKDAYLEHVIYFLEGLYFLEL